MKVVTRGRRWRRNRDGSIYTGAIALGARINEVWEGRHAGRFNISAWSSPPLRFRPAPYFFATETKAIREAERWLAQHTKKGKRR